MNIKQSYLYLIISSAVAVVLRTLMLTFAIDPDSGFIKNEYNLIAVAVFAAIGLLAALCFLFGFLPRAKYCDKAPHSYFYKFSSVALAAVILYDTVFSRSEYPASAFFKTAELITAILSAIVLISFVITDYMNLEFPIILSVAPVLYWFVRLIIVFTSLSTLASTPDSIFELAALSLILISSLQAAKTLCIEQRPKIHSLNFALFLTTALTCFTTALPRAILTAGENASLLHSNDLPMLSTLVAGIYFLSFAIDCYKENKA